MIAKETGERRAAVAQIAIGYLPATGAKVDVVEAQTKGYICTEPRGAQGFGWDEIFIPEGETKTYAEMTLEEKNRTSMRAKVADSFKILLRDVKATPSSNLPKPALVADKSLERPPEGLLQATLSFFWPERQWARKIVLVIVLLVAGAYVLWASLPDSAKERIINWFGR